MLTKPEFGWTNISLKENEYFPASYITDVSYDCLEEMIKSLKEYSDFCVTFDAEGYNYKIIADEYQSFILFEDEIEEIDKVKHATCNVYDKSKEDLAKELLKDIKNNFEEWYLFPTDTCFTKEELDSLKEKEDKTEEDLLYIAKCEKILINARKKLETLVNELENEIEKRNFKKEGRA